MIPIRDNIRSRRFPMVNVTLIIINIVLFIYEQSLNQGRLVELITTFGVSPRKLSAMVIGEYPIMPAALPLFTAMFLHGGWFHLLGNMLYLWIFGDNVEDRFGRLRYLLVYLGAGVAGSLAQYLANPLAAEPVIGASGAIAGVLGAYFISYPRAKVLTLLPIFFFITFIEIPAFTFLFLWFILQWLNGFLTMAVPGNAVAWWAHIGGFVAGIISVWVFAPAKRRRYL